MRAGRPPGPPRRGRFLSQFGKTDLELLEEYFKSFPGIPIIPGPQDILTFYNQTGWIVKRLEDLEKRMNIPKSIWQNKK